MSTITRVYGPRFITKQELMGIRFAEVDPAAPGAGETPAEPVQPAEPATPPTEPAPADPAPGAQEEPPTGDEPKTFSPEYVAQLRKEAAGYREKAKTDAAEAAEQARKDLAQQIGKALGLVQDDTPPDPDALITQAQAERAAALDEAIATKRELAVVRNADKHDAKIDELLDSNVFASKLKDLDPAADDFASQVDELIKSTVDSNPARFKRVQMAPGTGSTDHTGDSSAAQLSREELAALSPEERLKAAKDGRLSRLLGK